MISIIGAGPAGSRTAYLLAKKGFEVSLFEEHPVIGKPVHCTGIVTSAIAKIVRIPKDCISTKVSTTRIFSPAGDFLEVDFHADNLVLDRQRFDSWLCDKAQDAGATLYLSHKFVRAHHQETLIRNNERTIKVKSEYLIGADGPSSEVAKSSGLFGNRHFWLGLQARVRLSNNNIVEFYPHIGSFAWIVPESGNIMRIGLLARSNVRQAFDKFLQEKKLSHNIIDMQAGLVPVYDPRLPVMKDKTFLVGDSAAFVKATTGGGIMPSLLASQALADTILSQLDYPTQLGGLRKSLYIHLMVRKALDNFSSGDYEKLLDYCRQERVNRVLAKFDRDNILPLSARLVLTEPRLLLFLRHLF